MREKMFFLFLFLSAISASTQAMAEQRESVPPATVPPATDKAGAIVAPIANLSERDLAAVTGGAAPQVLTLTNQKLSGISNGNSLNAESIESGAVNFSANALSGFNGIGNFVINTGNNNVLQGSLSVTIVTAPLP